MCPPASSIQAIIAEIAKSDTIIYLDDLLPIVYDYVNPPPLMECKHAIEVGASRFLEPRLPIPYHTMPSSGTDIRR
jgi:hypothetical protein